MPIKNYTTDVAEERTVSEIMGLLASKGARSIEVNYDQRNRPSAVSFILMLGPEKIPVPLRRPCNFTGVFRAMARQYKDSHARRRFERNLQSMDQARCIAWRIVKDWIAAQMALVEAEQAQVAEVFLPYAVHESGQSMFERFIESYTKVLPQAPLRSP
jgi:hypothetical protein